MLTTSFIDWMSYVLENVIAETEADFMYFFRILNLGTDGFKRCKPRNAYKIAYMNEQGALIMCSPCRPDMGINVLLTGSVLAKYDWLTVLQALNAQPGHFTRLDLTIDARDHGLSIDSLYMRADSGHMKCKAQNVSRVQSKTGSTCYVGSRTSERFMRIYDKAGEQGITGEDWKRIELEASGQKASWIGSFIANTGASAIASLIKDFIDFEDYAPWQGIFATVTAQKTISDKRVSDTEKWLLETIAPTLAKQIVLDPTFDFDFQEALRACIRELTKTE